MLISRVLAEFKLKPKGLKLAFSRNSFESGALMITRRTLEGAEKCAFRLLRRADEIPSSVSACHSIPVMSCLQLTLVHLRHLGGFAEILMPSTIVVAKSRPWHLSEWCRKNPVPIFVGASPT